MRFFAIAGTAAAHIMFETKMTDYVRAPNLVQSLVQAMMKDPSPGQKVEFETCDTDLDVFEFDEDATTVDPNPPQKNADINFGLAGGLNDEMDLTNIHIHVDWNSSPLYDEDHAVTEGPFTGDDFNYPLTWNVPSYAFDGIYKINLKGTQDDGQTVMCINAAFAF